MPMMLSPEGRAALFTTFVGQVRGGKAGVQPQIDLAFYEGAPMDTRLKAVVAPVATTKVAMVGANDKTMTVEFVEPGKPVVAVVTADCKVGYARLFAANGVLFGQLVVGTPDEARRGKAVDLVLERTEFLSGEVIVLGKLDVKLGLP